MFQNKYRTGAVIAIIGVVSLLACFVGFVVLKANSPVLIGVTVLSFLLFHVGKLMMKTSTAKTL